MRDAARRFERVVREHFDFLLEHGFRFDRTCDTAWETTATYLSRTLGIEVAESREFDRVEVTLIRLHEGELPEHQIWVTEEPISRVLFDNVVLVRAPWRKVELPSPGLRGNAVPDQVRLWAELLRSVAPDFLEGDDAAMVEAERLIRERVAEHPQEVTIWLPRHASPDAEEAAVEQARRGTPPEIGIVVRRYRS